MLQSGEASTSFIALMASNSSLNSVFSSRNEMFGLSVIVSKADRSTSLVMLSSWSKWFANPSRISGFSCITVSPSRTVSCVAPLYKGPYTSLRQLQMLSYRFHLLPAAILHHLPPAMETSFPLFTAVDSVDHRSVLPFTCLIQLFHPCISSFL